MWNSAEDCRFQAVKALLCATSAFSVSLWLFFLSTLHHRDTENAEVAQRNHFSGKPFK